MHRHRLVIKTALASLSGAIRRNSVTHLEIPPVLQTDENWDHRGKSRFQEGTYHPRRAQRGKRKGPSRKLPESGGAADVEAGPRKTAGATIRSKKSKSSGRRIPPEQLRPAELDRRRIRVKATRGVGGGGRVGGGEKLGRFLPVCGGIKNGISIS